MEEDAGKNVHGDFGDPHSYVDLNRTGVPLVEIVSEPDIRTPEEARLYLQKLRTVMRYLGVSDADMEKGEMRCDANISIRPKGQEAFGVKTELKNMNSFRHVQRALEYEIKRQQKVLEEGERITQETLLWNPQLGVTETMRSKEEAHDYRYFPEPDLVPVFVDLPWFEKIQSMLPELPDEKFERFKKQYGLPDYDVTILTENRDFADYFEKVAVHIKDFKMISNWMLGEVSRVLNEKKITIAHFPVTPEKLADLLKAIKEKVVSASAAKKVFDYLLANEVSVKQAIEKLGFTQISDESEIEAFVQQVIDENPGEVEAYRNGKTKVLGFLVGQVMRISRGKANPQLVNTLLRKKLDS
jgi:aspartyl-tRNA(Asn)/glutamyl-tRNA(Gln) amidotransferase subunit B